MKHLISILAFGFFSQVSWAGTAPQGVVTGYVASFDADTVKLYVKGEFVKVPRSALSKDANIRVGQEVTALIEINNKVAAAPR